MCIYYFDSKHIFDKFNAIPIVLFNPDIKNIDLDFQDDIMYRFHNDHFSNKKNINIYLKGEAKHDEIKTQYAQIVIREMIKTKDTTICVNVHIQTNCKYGNFIDVLDLMYKENVENYLVTTDGIKAIYRNREVMKMRIAGGYLSSCRGCFIDKTFQEDFSNNKLPNIFQYVKVWFLPILLFIAICFLALFRIKNMNISPQKTNPIT
jgi:hypothetical protein